MRLPILTWHAVVPLAAGEQRRGTVSLSAFRRQVGWLARRGFSALSPDEAVDVIEGRRPAPRRPIVLTFDDGYRCIVEHALPVLEEAGLRATLFVVTGAVGGTTSYYAAKGGTPLEHADWEELGRAAAAGHLIGSHTVRHARLPELPPAALDEELGASREDIGARIGPCDHLAYPYGAVTDAVADAARRAGYRTACTTRRGFNRHGERRVWLRRQNVGRLTGPLRFARRAGRLW